jgi:hypothetical protein
MTDFRLFNMGTIIVPGRDGARVRRSPRLPGVSRDDAPPAARGGRLEWLLLGIALLPVAAGLRLVTDGGGYLVSAWGTWACLMLLALAVLVASGVARAPAPAALVAPLCVAGLGAWSLVSVLWAAWPQNALVEAGREIFYAAVLALAVLALRVPWTRRAAAVAVAASSGALTLGLALLLARGSSPEALFSAGRLVGHAGYTGALGAALAVGFWPAVAAAGDRDMPLLVRIAAGLTAGAALAAIVPVEARAPLAALAVSGVVFLALGPTPVRSGFVAAVAAVAVAARWHELNAAYSAGGAGVHAMRDTGRGILEVALATAAVVAIYALADRRVRLDRFGRQLVATLAAIALAAAGIAALAVALDRTGGDPLGWVRDHATVAAGDQAPARDRTRLLWLSPHDREDLWRAASLSFGRRPLTGYGGGNFGYAYERERRVQQQVQQAHSETLEVASTLGYPGLLLYAPFFVLPLGAAVLLRRRPMATSERLAIAGAAAGFIGFALHSQVDWIWHLSGAALPALVLAAVPLAALPSAGRRIGRRSAIAVSAAALLAAVLLVAPATLAQRYLLRSYDDPPARALDDARRADTFDWLSGRPQLAIARARLAQGDAAGALAAAKRAAASEPDFWVAWETVLVAAARAGDGELAREAAARVERLTPRLPTIMRAQLPSTDFDHY